MSDSVKPHRRQPTRLRHPWDSPGKNTGVGCHFLLQCMKVKSESEVTQSCLTLSDPMDCSLPSSSIRGTLQARVLEWVAIAFSDIVSPSLAIFFALKSTVSYLYCHFCFLSIDIPLHSFFFHSFTFYTLDFLKFDTFFMSIF